MKHVRIVDKRPALAFDSQEETQLIADSLNAYRYSHVIKCQEMFNKKEE